VIREARVDSRQNRRQSGGVDAELTLAARALDAGHVLEALKRVALRNDAPALGLRGVALARLGQFERARELLRAAARGFGASAPLGRARCLLADAEIALVSRDLRGVEAALDGARRTLLRHGDALNAAHAACLQARSLLLRGRTSEAERALRPLLARRAPPALRAQIELTWAEHAVRTLDPRAARAALARAHHAAEAAGSAALRHEVAAAEARLNAPVARLLRAGEAHALRLEELAALPQQRSLLLVDARELSVQSAAARVALGRRPVLFALARALAEAWPAPATRASLIFRAFAVTRASESQRARLRVEIARLRRALRGVAQISATADGFELRPLAAREVAVLSRLFDDEHAAILALLEDGEAWSSSALSVALGVSQRSVQRALLALEPAGKVRATGRARARRWLLAPGPEFATPLLLQSALTSA